MSGPLMHNCANVQSYDIWYLFPHILLSFRIPLPSLFFSADIVSRRYITRSFIQLFQVFFNFCLLNKSSLEYSIKIHIYFISPKHFIYLCQVIFSYIIYNLLTWYKMNLFYLWQVSTSKPYCYELLSFMPTDIS